MIDDPIQEKMYKQTDPTQQIVLRARARARTHTHTHTHTHTCIQFKHFKNKLEGTDRQFASSSQF